VSKRGGTAQLVRDLRQRLGLTQEKMAPRLGVTFPTINRWEKGRAKPSPLALKQIEDLLVDLGDNGRDLVTKYLTKKRI
jgi:putative transcriptional regulator